MDKNEQIVNDLLPLIGNKENISSATHCATRLRLNVKDKNAVDLEKIGKVKGVMGVQQVGEQLQVIIGPAVGKVYEAFIKVTGLKAEAAIEENLDEPKKKVIDRIFDYISGSITPLLPAFTAAGLFKTLVAIFGPNLLGWFGAESDIYVLLTFLGDAGFYFLPILLGVSASMKLKVPWIYGAYIGAIMQHPSFTALNGQPFTVFGIPCNVQDYASTVIPILMITWLMSYVYKFLRDHVHENLQLILVPFATLLIMTPIALCLIGPAGSFLSNYIQKGVLWMNSVAGPLATTFIGAFFAPIVFTGMHIIFYVYLYTTFPTMGYDTFFLPGVVASSWVIVGIWLGCMVKYKKRENKTFATTSFITWLIGGVGEPFMFGVLLKNKKLLLASCVAGGAAGLVAGITHLTAYVLSASNGIYGLLAFLGGPAWNYVALALTLAAAIGGAFAATVFLGVDED
ncbi:MAG: PTS transporter subunit EIIC [Erysipelotrichaceae bacterium]|nr:PTS transporter subunit EIIC [Erysipelotrichaceae bacterium]